MNEVYQSQDRGSTSAYDRYLRGMDASMRQKVALTAAHLLCEGELADMGMGSGSGSHALAALYPGLRVIGVDVDPEMVARAGERFALPNLRFVRGDIAERCFEPQSIEAILNSSVLHHVTSFNGYDRSAASRALEMQVEQLSANGVLIVRDFVDPGAGKVWLDLPADDAVGTADTPTECSTADLFERFAREFRSLRPEPQRGFDFRRIDAEGAPTPAAGRRRYELTHTHAAEFVLRKDYRQSWDVEVQEEYTYATQQELEQLFARLGLRVLASTPIRNPWIVANRFRDHFELYDLDGHRLDVPATNYVIVGQKVPAGEGVRMRSGGEAAPLDYLEMSHWRRDDGAVYDLVRRPGATFDVLPWFERDGSCFVLARRSYPRPILALETTPSIDGTRAPHYVSEPLNVQQRDKPLGQTVEELLASFDDIGSHRIRAFDRGRTYYPSPGGIQEQVQSVLVAIEPPDCPTHASS
jgi:hypothetical protein